MQGTAARRVRVQSGKLYVESYGEGNPRHALRRREGSRQLTVDSTEKRFTTEGTEGTECGEGEK
jgi:hypothetical protein